jgi:predicted porin
MKKAALALLALSAFSGAVSAQTNVTIYGVVDMGYAHENNGSAAGSENRLDSGLLNGSRLGFKGSEDLGGGMSAIFALENGFNADTGTLGQGGLLFGRQAWVGLDGGFGTARLGRQNTVVYANSPVFDPFGNALAGDSARLFNYSGSRTNNAISYGYEANNGFRGQLNYGFGEIAGDTSAGRTMAAFGGYRNGPIDAVLTYHRVTDATGNVSGATTLLGGNYNFGVLKAYLAYAMNKDVTPAGVISAGADTRNSLVGLTAPVGAAGTVIASYMHLTDKVVDNADADQFAIGYTHDLSKRTALYTSYARLKNESAARYRVSAVGLTDSLFNVGVRHRF